MKVVILANVKHDGETLEIGKTYDVSESLARRLLDTGAAEAPKKKKEEKEDAKA